MLCTGGICAETQETTPQHKPGEACCPDNRNARFLRNNLALAVLGNSFYHETEWMVHRILLFHNIYAICLTYQGNGKCTVVFCEHKFNVCLQQKRYSCMFTISPQFHYTAMAKHTHIYIYIYIFIYYCICVGISRFFYLTYWQAYKLSWVLEQAFSFLLFICSF